MGATVRAVRRPEVVRHRVVMFQAGAWQHRGYNISVANLHERPIVLDDSGYGIAGTTQDRLRLFHFHAFDTSRPEELSTRLASSTAHLRTEGTAVNELLPGVRRRADRARGRCSGRRWPTPTGPTPAAGACRASCAAPTGSRTAVPPNTPAVTVPPRGGGGVQRVAAPRPKTEANELLGDFVKSARLALPEEYGRLRSRFPRLVDRAARQGGRQRRRHLEVAESDVGVVRDLSAPANGCERPLNRGVPRRVVGQQSIQ